MKSTRVEAMAPSGSLSRERMDVAAGHRLLAPATNLAKLLDVGFNHGNRLQEEGRETPHKAIFALEICNTATRPTDCTRLKPEVTTDVYSEVGMAPVFPGPEEAK